MSEPQYVTISRRLPLSRRTRLKLWWHGRKRRRWERQNPEMAEAAEQVRREAQRAFLFGE